MTDTHTDATALEALAARVERLAFSLPAPNKVTPQLVQAAVEMRAILLQKQRTRPMTDTPEQMRQRIVELEEGLRSLVTALKKDFTNDLTEGPNGYCPDDASVMDAQYDSGAVTFGLIRKAATLLAASPPVSEPDAGEVERVARIIFDADHPTLNQYNRDHLWGEEYGGLQPRYDILARAAITALYAAHAEAGFVEVSEGKLWSIIKSGLAMGHTDMRKIVEADKFETAAAHEDELARKLSDRVFAMLAKAK